MSNMFNATSKRPSAVARWLSNLNKKLLQLNMIISNLTKKLGPYVSVKVKNVIRIKESILHLVS